MKFKQNGYTFTDEAEQAISINNYCKNKKVKAKAFVAEKDGCKEIVLFNKNGKPIFSSQKLEDVVVHVDIMAIAKEK